MTDSKLPGEAQPTPPSPSFLRRIELATIEKACDLLGIPDKSKSAKLAKLTPEQEDELRRIESDAVARYRGDLSLLESALGMLRMGHHFGWKALYIIHSKKTIRNYEDILDIQIRNVFPETGPSGYRLIGLAIAEQYPNFWKVAGGDIKIPKRRDTTP
jgi:hypothetical protein